MHGAVRRIPSSDGVSVALHDLGGHDLGGTGVTLLISHATGFHGRCYLPIAHALADRFHSVAPDLRNHGDTATGDTAAGDIGAAAPVDWRRYGDDAEAVALAVAADSPRSPLVGFGHSMGAACLLMVALRQPGLFQRLVLFEPIVFPAGLAPLDGHENPLVEGARRRRSRFPSYDEAIRNFASKPPMNSFSPAALEAYVRFGFAKSPAGAEGPDGSVHLKCRPEVEAATFSMGSRHGTWELLGDIATPVTVVTGRPEPMRPSERGAGIADALPNGRYVQLDDLDHFGPMVDPQRIAEIIATG